MNTVTVYGTNEQCKPDYKRVLLTFKTQSSILTTLEMVKCHLPTMTDGIDYVVNIH